MSKQLFNSSLRLQSATHEEEIGVSGIGDPQLVARDEKVIAIFLCIVHYHQKRSLGKMTYTSENRAAHLRYGLRRKRIRTRASL